MSKLLLTEGVRYVSESEANILCRGHYNTYMRRDANTPLLNNCETVPVHYQALQMVRSFDGIKWRRSNLTHILGGCYMHLECGIVFTYQVTVSCVTRAMALEKLTGVTMDANITPLVFENILINVVRGQFTMMEENMKKVR